MNLHPTLLSKSQLFKIPFSFLTISGEAALHKKGAAFFIFTKLLQNH